MITFFVKGEPRAKQSFRIGANGRGFQTARVKSWQADIGWIAQQRMRALDRKILTGALQVIMVFYMPNLRRIDIDNLSKGVLDGLNGICWQDDRQIVDLHLHKRLAFNEETCGVIVVITGAPVVSI